MFPEKINFKEYLHAIPKTKNHIFHTSLAMFLINKSSVEFFFFFNLSFALEDI